MHLNEQAEDHHRRPHKSRNLTETLLSHTSVRPHTRTRIRATRSRAKASGIGEKSVQQMHLHDRIHSPPVIRPQPRQNLRQRHAQDITPVRPRARAAPAAPGVRAPEAGLDRCVVGEPHARNGNGGNGGRGNTCVRIKGFRMATPVLHACIRAHRAGGARARRRPPPL